MLRAGWMLSVVLGVALSVPESASAQVGFGVARQNGVVTGGFFSALPVVTNGGTYVRMGITTGVNQLVDVHTFSPVRNFPGLVPIAPIGFGGGFNQGFGGGMNRGMAGQGNPGNNVANNAPVNSRPNPIQFVAAAGRFDADRNQRLDKEELEQVAKAVVAELKRTPGFDFRRMVVASPQLTHQKGAQPVPTAEQVTEAFVTRCLKFDRDDDESLNPEETRRMAAALIRSLS